MFHNSLIQNAGHGFFISNAQIVSKINDRLRGYPGFCAGGELDAELEKTGVWEIFLLI